MTTVESPAHRKGRNFSCTIERIMPFGIFVRLQDGSRGYIRRREVSYSGDQAAMSELRLGDRINAVVVEEESPGRTLELSLKSALPDPWLRLSRDFRVGSTIEGTVKRLTTDGAYIEVLPGVDGFAPKDELAPWAISTPNDVVWPGDRVRAAITFLNPTERRLRLSLKRCLDKAAFVQSVLDVVRGTSGNLDPDKKDLDYSTQVDLAPERDFDPVQLDGSVLVVEDTPDIREPLVRWLKDRGCEAQEAQSSTHALKLCDDQRFALVIADLDMPDLDGASLVRELRQRDIRTPIAIMSDPDLIARNLPVLQSFDVATAFPKPLDLREVHEFLMRLANGECPTLETKADAAETSSEVQPFQELTRLARTHNPGEGRFQHILQQLVSDTNASLGVVFRLDSVSKNVSIVAKAGDLPLRINALYGLLESPVKDVIVEERLILENHVSRERAGQFRKLLEMLSFESCIAVPLSAAGRTEHAMFLFHVTEGAFSPYRQRDAVAASALLAAILENQALDERLRSLSSLLLSGQLAAGFNHEVHNKLASLDLQFQNLKSDMDRTAREHAELSGLENFVAVQNAVDQAIRTSTELKRTVDEFRRLMGTRGDHAVDINLVIRQAELLIRPLANQARVNVELVLAEGLPRVVGNSLGMQQVFLNLMLNAVQHTGKKKHDLRLLTVSTSCHERDSEWWVQARFSDTGPGIHLQLWQSAFALGFTTRPDGSGLGLYIAESLVNNMGGRICIESSLVPFGTTFLVELPAIPAKESQEP